MKTFLVIGLLTLSTSAYAATIGPIDELKKPISEKDEKAFIKKTGDVMLTVGKLLQGDMSFATTEDPDSVLSALQTLNTSLATGDDTDQYFIVILLKAVAAAVISAGVSTGVGLQVDKALKKGFKKRG